MEVDNPTPDKKPLGSKGIIITVALTALVPLLLIVGFILNQFEDAYQAKITDHLSALVKKHSHDIDGFLTDRLGDIRVLARSHAAEELRDQVFLQKMLAILREEYGGALVDLGLIDPNGIQQTYAGPFNLAKANYAGAGWFSEVQKREYFLSDVFTGLRGTPHFIVAVKVMIDNQAWILRATVDFKAFNSLVSSIRIGATGFAFVLNRDGAFQTKPEFDVALHQGPYKSFLKNSFSAGEVILRRADDGRGRESLFACTALNQDRWVLCFQQEVSDAFSILNRTRVLTALLCLCSALAVGWIALILSRKMTHRLTEVLVEKEKMSDQVVEAGRLASIGELAAGIAHEINNPVAIMVEEAGWVQDLLSEEDPTTADNITEITRAAAQIRTQGARCKEITQKLLSFARKTDPTIKEIQINDLVEDVISLIAQKARYANVKVETNLGSDLNPVMASASELQQVLLNLFNNSVDAMDQSGGEIRVISRSDDGGVTLEIADNGIGIAEANLARIFDPFYTTKPVGQGTGLGLSICYGIIKKLGGDISVRSAKQKGTTFTIFLPTPAPRKTGPVPAENSAESNQSPLKED